MITARDDYGLVLRDVAGDVPEHDVDWVTFHDRLIARAELPLRRLQHGVSVSVVPRRPVPVRALATPWPRRPAPRPRRWWHYTARWAGGVISGALAAGVVLGAFVRVTPRATGGTTTVDATADSDAATRAAFETAVIRGPTTTADLTLLPTTTDLLLTLGSAPEADVR